MNRKKKLNQIFNKRLKKAKAKLNPNKKEKYIAKADRVSEEPPLVAGASIEDKDE